MGRYWQDRDYRDSFWVALTMVVIAAVQAAGLVMYSIGSITMGPEPRWLFPVVIGSIYTTSVIAATTAIMQLKARRVQLYSAQYEQEDRKRYTYGSSDGL